MPGGLRAAQAAAGDEAAPDRAHFLVDLIRRTYDSPILRVDDPRAVRLQALSAALKSGESAAGPFETLPLPLTPDVWIESVFGRQATPATLVRSIAESRGAALFYYGLLSLDDDTRTWIGGQRALIADLVTRYPGAFVAAAPALRMTSSGLRLPGGAAADATWQALAGRKPGDPGSFVRSLLSLDEGRLASFAGALAQLTPAQAALALGLDSPDASRRIDSVRRLYATFLRMAPVRSVEKRTFTRVALDPLFLLAELDAVRGDRPLVPGTRGFWSTVFAESDGRGTLAKEDPRKHPDWRQPADFVWLSDQVFRDTESDSRRRYMMVLFAARHLRPGSLDSADGARDAVDAVHASGSHPALSVALERAGIDDLSVFARTMRRASELDGIGDGARQWRALAQFQGALALVTRAAQRHTVSAEEASTLVASLAAIPLTKDDEYDGGIVRWLCGWLQEAAPEEPAAPSGAGGPGSLREIVQDGVAGPVEASACACSRDRHRRRRASSTGKARRTTLIFRERKRSG